MAIVRAPNGAFNGMVADVEFVDGVAETSDTWALAYFARHGYDIETEETYPAELEITKELDPVEMTVKQLLYYAEQEEINLRGATRKADILAAITFPGPPTAVGGTPGAAQVSVAWEAPAYAGEGTISGYEVITYQDGEEIEREENASSPLVVTELENGETYTFAVRAENEHGWGPVSMLSEPVVPSAVLLPGKPTSVAGDPGDGEASVSWTAPDDTGIEGGIIGYEVIAYISSVEDDRKESAESPFVFDGLTNDTEYTFTVRAQSNYGWGEESDPSAGVTPTDGE